MSLAMLFDTPADDLDNGDYVRFVHESVEYEGYVLSVQEGDDGNTVFVALASEGDYGDRIEVEVPWDLMVPVLAQDYSDVESV